MNGTRSAERRTQRARGDGGAVVVEFALIAPFFFLIIFGIIEFGWAFGQHLDTRHAAREGSRLAAVNFNPNDLDPSQGVEQTADMRQATCERMQLSSDTMVRFALRTPGEDEIGDFLVVTVETELDQITGFLAPFLDDVTLSSSVESRLEQDATWDPSQGLQPCP